MAYQEISGIQFKMRKKYEEIRKYSLHVFGVACDWSWEKIQCFAWKEHFIRISGIKLDLNSLYKRSIVVNKLIGIVIDSSRFELYLHCHLQRNCRCCCWFATRRSLLLLICNEMKYRDVNREPLRKPQNNQLALTTIYSSFAASIFVQEFRAIVIYQGKFNCLIIFNHIFPTNYFNSTAWRLHKVFMSFVIFQDSFKIFLKVMSVCLLWGNGYHSLRHTHTHIK